jgi:hypothetical protein
MRLLTPADEPTTTARQQLIELANQEGMDDD